MHRSLSSDWDSFFVAGAGAAAALTGLVFVALSINLTKILSFPGLPRRAGETIVMLTEALMVTLLGLVPQVPRALALELIAVGLVGWGFMLGMLVHLHDDGDVTTPGQKAIRVGLGQLATLPVIVAGISLWVGAGGRLYWLVAGLLFLL